MSLSQLFDQMIKVEQVKCFQYSFRYKKISFLIVVFVKNIVSHTTYLSFQIFSVYQIDGFDLTDGISRIILTFSVKCY